MIRFMHYAHSELSLPARLSERNISEEEYAIWRIICVAYSPLSCSHLSQDYELPPRTKAAVNHCFASLVAANQKKKTGKMMHRAYANTSKLPRSQNMYRPKGSETKVRLICLLCVTHKPAKLPLRKY